MLHFWPSMRPAAKKLLTRDDPPAQPPYRHDLAPISTINSDSCPAFFAAPVRAPEFFHLRARMIPNALLAAHNLTRVELRVAQARPHAADTHRIGPGAQPEATMHIGRHLQPRPMCRGSSSSRAADSAGLRPDERQLRKTVAYALELQQWGQQDVDVRLATPRLVQSGDCLGAEDPHGDFLRHDRFALARKGGIEAARAAVEAGPAAKPVVIVAGAPCRQCAVRSAGRGRDDRESEKRHVVLLCQAN